jgi:hypothetical protein
MLPIYWATCENSRRGAYWYCKVQLAGCAVQVVAWGVTDPESFAPQGTDSPGTTQHIFVREFCITETQLWKRDAHSRARMLASGIVPSKVASTSLAQSTRGVRA